MKLKKEKVMLVDSSDNLRHVIKDYFEMSGYEVVDFKEGSEADASFNKGMYDICVIDVALKHYDGYKLLQNMRKIDKNVPIIVLSSYNSKEDRIKGFNLGCDDYVTKPFSIEELGLRMQAILRRCRNNVRHEYVAEDETIKFGSHHEARSYHVEQDSIMGKKQNTGVSTVPYLLPYFFLLPSA